MPSQECRAKFARHWKMANGKVHVVHRGVAGNDGGDKDDEAVARFGLALGYVLSVANALPDKNTIGLLEAHGEWAAFRAGREPQLVLVGIPEVGVVIPGEATYGTYVIGAGLIGAIALIWLQSRLFRVARSRTRTSGTRYLKAKRLELRAA